MKASFNTQNVNSNSSNHMMRKSKVTYLIEPNSKNNEYKILDNDRESFVQKAQESYKKRTKQNMQKKQKDSLIKEAVINIQKNTSLNDIEKLFENLNSEFGGYKVFEIAAHKDEGYFFNKKEELEYRPNADIFFNEKDSLFYLDKEHKNKANMDDFELRYNYHAHVIYSPFDLKTGKGRATRNDMRKVQTIVADSLDMQRGEINSKAKRMSHWQLKQQADIKRAIKKEELAKQKDLKDEISKLRAELKEAGAKRADYAKLEELNRELKAKISEKELTTKALRDTIIMHKNTISSKQTKIEALENTVLNIEERNKNQIEEIKTENETLETENYALKSNLNSLEAKVTELQDKTTENQLKEEIGHLKAKYDTKLEKIERQEQNNKRYLIEIEKLSEAIKNKDIDIIKANESINELNEKITNISAKAVRYEEEYTKHKSKTKNYALKSDLEYLEEQNKDLEYKVSNMVGTKEFDTLKSENDKLKKDSEQIKYKNEFAKEFLKIKPKEAKNMNLKNIFSLVVEKINIIKTNFENKIDELVDIIKSKDKKINDLKNDLDYLEEKNKELNKENWEFKYPNLPYSNIEHTEEDIQKYTDNINEFMKESEEYIKTNTNTNLSL